jgi:hypothetical protein
MATLELNFPEGPWRSLFQRTMALLDEIESKGTTIPQWTLGGGTVLMFHYQHRLSKDIDIFIADPQFLGYINPKLGGPAENVTTDYKESANFIKLYLDEGEIDFIATTPLTNMPYVRHEVLGRSILLETPTEIVAKKMWHRGDVATARDLFDLALVIEREAETMRLYPDVFQKNSEPFIAQCKSRQKFLELQFDQIEKIGFKRSYSECLEIAEAFLNTI